jgi:hypothetical protein
MKLVGTASPSALGDSMTRAVAAQHHEAAPNQSNLMKITVRPLGFHPFLDHLDGLSPRCHQRQLQPGLHRPR